VSVTASPARNEPDPATLALVYEEVGVQLDKQFEQINELNSRAQQLLAFAGGTFGLVIALQPPKDSWWMSGLYFGGLFIFGYLVYNGYQAWSIRGWRRDPEPEHLWRRYQLWPENWLREQIIWNRIQSRSKNQLAIDEKVARLRTTQWLLALLVGYLVLALILRPAYE
jgi:hypothetical protein